MSGYKFYRLSTLTMIISIVGMVVISSAVGYYWYGVTLPSLHASENLKAELVATMAS
ncbi:MAG: hypothetical protein GY806_20070, partial [Gammaproteobacteria bacterium]|nr:hypothetical protein [Gammaproteobacteria bacterium]